MGEAVYNFIGRRASNTVMNALTIVVVRCRFVNFCEFLLLYAKINTEYSFEHFTPLAEIYF